MALSDDGRVLAAGAPGQAGNKDRPGYAILFRREASGWTQAGDALVDEVDGDRFGYSLSLSGDGAVVAVLSHAGDAPYAKLYRLDGASAAYRQRGRTIRGDAGEGGTVFFGNSLLSGDGSMFATGSHGASGDVGVYEWDEAASDY